MSTMTYKNYLARIELDERDNIFVGRVLCLRFIISFHGETVSELRHEFEVAMDDFFWKTARPKTSHPKNQPQASSCCVCHLKRMALHWWRHKQQGRV